ncbi:MAG: DUF2537 domain-containing protein [Actinomycetota bacterium]|nr:DUF2537 domain-containing protein [Actinomycetota bacterium]
MELRTRGDRAVIVGRPQAGDTTDREVDPSTLPLGADLTAALHEWARAVLAISRHDSGEVSTSVVAHRGRQLAARIAHAMGAPVHYVDPFTGGVSVVEAPAPPVDRHSPTEPTPWGTGAAVTVITFVVVLFAILTLATTLNDTSAFLALGANVVVSAGLLPSVWLARGVATWRWVAYGVFAGIVAGWLGLLVILFA